MATPIELTLERELSVEWQRFANKWLFPWHNINIDGKVVDVEDFRGGRFHTGGIVFQGQIREMYWQAIKRYLAQKIDETFQRWDEASRTYPEGMREASLEGVRVLLEHFVARIVQKATETDQVLRGRGYPDRVVPYNSTGVQSGAFAQIERISKAHQTIAELNRPKLLETPPELSRLQRLERWYSDHKAVVWIIGILLGGLYALARLF